MHVPNFRGLTNFHIQQLILHLCSKQALFSTNKIELPQINLCHRHQPSKVVPAPVSPVSPTCIVEFGLRVPPGYHAATRCSPATRRTHAINAPTTEPALARGLVARGPVAHADTESSKNQRTTRHNNRSLCTVCGDLTVQPILTNCQIAKVAEPAHQISICAVECKTVCSFAVLSFAFCFAPTMKLEIAKLCADSWSTSLWTAVHTSMRPSTTGRLVLEDVSLTALLFVFEASFDRSNLIQPATIMRGDRAIPATSSSWRPLSSVHSSKHAPALATMNVKKNNHQHCHQVKLFSSCQAMCCGSPHCLKKARCVSFAGFVRAFGHN